MCPKRFYFHSEQIPALSICILSTDSQLLIYPHVEKVRIFRKTVHTQPANFLFLKSVFYLSFTNSVLQIWILIYRNNFLLTGNKNEVRKPVFCDSSSGFWTSWFPILFILLILDYCLLRKILFLSLFHFCPFFQTQLVQECLCVLVTSVGNPMLLQAVGKFKNASAFLPPSAWCEAPSAMRGCDPPCLSMLHNAPVEHCGAETSRIHRLEFVYIKPLRISIFWKNKGPDLMTTVAVNDISCALSVLQRIQQPFKSSNGTPDRFFRLSPLVICSGGSQPGDIGGLHFFQLF